MKKLWIVLITLSLLLTIPGVAKKSKKRGFEKLQYPKLNEFNIPPVLKAETGNAIKLRLIESKKLPLIDMTVLFKGGDVYDPQDKVGLAAITANLLRIGGTKEWNPEEIEQRLDSQGIQVNISASTDYFSVNLSCLKANFPAAVEMLAKMLMEPAFNKEKFEEIKTRLASTVSRRNDEAGPIRSREFAKLIYGEKSPFAAVLEYDHLDGINLDDVTACTKKFFAPDNMLAGISGPIELAEVKSVFEKYFTNWNNRSQIPVYPAVTEPSHQYKVAFAEKSNLTQSYISIGHLGSKENIGEKADILVFNSIFSSGMDSRLFTRIRTKMGLTYGVGGGIITEHWYPGKTAFTTFTKSESTLPAIKAILEEIDIIRKEKVTQEELKDAKDSFVNSYVFQYQSAGKILSNELTREFYGLPEGYSQKLLEDIKKVTAEDVLSTAKKYLDPARMMILIVGKEKDIAGNMEDLGKVKKLDISIKPPAVKEVIPQATPEMLQKGKALIDRLRGNKYRKYRQLKTLEIEADMEMSMMGQTMSMSTRSVQEFPDKVYVEVNVMGMKILRIINGNAGVMKQMGQEKPISEKEIIEGRFGSTYDIFVSRDKYSFQYLKQMEREGRTYDVLYVFDDQKNWIKFYVNSNSGLIEIEEKLSKIPGAAGVAREVKTDFRMVNGIPFAYRSETTVKDKKVMTITVKSIKVNSKVDRTLFDLK